MRLFPGIPSLPEDRMRDIDPGTGRHLLETRPTSVRSRLLRETITRSVLLRKCFISRICDFPLLKSRRCSRAFALLSALGSMRRAVRKVSFGFSAKRAVTAEASCWMVSAILLNLYQTVVITEIQSTSQLARGNPEFMHRTIDNEFQDPNVLALHIVSHNC